MGSINAYEADFLQGILKNKERKLAQTFNSIFYYINDILCFVGARAQLHACHVKT
jgi:hypothetical protein